MKNRIHGDENGMCVLDESKSCTECGQCDMCDLDPNKVCDNCGACLNQYNTDEKGYVKIKIDKIDTSGANPTLEDFYKELGLKDDDEDDFD